MSVQCVHAETAGIAKSGRFNRSPHEQGIDAFCASALVRFNHDDSNQYSDPTCEYLRSFHSVVVCSKLILQMIRKYQQPLGD